MNKPLPHLTSDDAAEKFVEDSDLSNFDLGAMKPHSFEFAPKSKQVNMRLSEQLLQAVKTTAAQQGISYQRFIRQVLEAATQPRA